MMMKVLVWCKHTDSLRRLFLQVGFFAYRYLPPLQQIETKFETHGPFLGLPLYT